MKKTNKKYYLKFGLIIILAKFIIVNQVSSQVSSDSLTYGLPEEVGMSSEGLSKALALYKNAITNDDLIGAVLLVARNGKIVLHEAIGLRDKQENLPMEKITFFRMASITKPVIATAILILSEQGKLDLDDPVHKYIPSFQNGQAREITIKQMLNHTSGLRIPLIYLFPLIEKSEKYPNAPSLQIEVSRFGEVGPSEEPGTTYSYSNPGYNTLGAIIEIVSGKSLEDFLIDEIHAPLGAKDSYHRLDSVDPSQLSSTYEKKDSVWIDIAAIETPLPIIIPAGSLISTALDLAKFCQLFLNGGIYAGKRILSQASVKEATTEGVFTEYTYPIPEVVQIRGYVPRWYYRRSAGSYKFQRGPEQLGLDTFYGYGWTIAKDGIFSHGGIYGTFAWVDSRRKIIGLILANSVGGYNPGVEFIESVNASIIEK